MNALNPSRSGFLNSRNSSIFFHTGREISSSVPKTHHKLHSHIVLEKQHMKNRRGAEGGEYYIEKEENGDEEKQNGGKR